MKNKILFVLLMFVSFIAFSQSITLTFNGMPTGNENVLIENLTRNSSTTVNGVNYIVLSTTDVYEVGNIESKSFPNPFNNETYIEFVANKNELVNVSVVNEIGQLVLRTSKQLKSKYYKIKFKAGKNGLFFINLKGKTFNKSFSVICNSTVNSCSQLSFLEVGKAESNYEKSVNSFVYAIGDLLKITATNNSIKSIITDNPSNSTTYDFIFDCIDYHNYAYKVTKVGTQWWMAENLKSTKYANGTNVSGTYLYGNNSANEGVYGRLYTWAAVMHGASGNNNIPSGVQGVCPNDWHVPSEAEWDVMRDELGGKIPMHGKLKETGTMHWNAPNSDASNEVGFTALPGGMRWDDGTFQYINEQAFFWNSTDDTSGIDVEHASGYTFFNETSDYYMYTWNLKTIAQSMRCVRD